MANSKPIRHRYQLLFMFVVFLIDGLAVDFKLMPSGWGNLDIVLAIIAGYVAATWSLNGLIGTAFTHRGLDIFNFFVALGLASVFGIAARILAGIFASFFTDTYLPLWTLIECIVLTLLVYAAYIVKMRSIPQKP